MSLGLGDLGKKRRPAKARSTTSTPAAGAWSGRSQTARPWSDGQIVQRTSSRRRSIDNEAVMNEDWLNLFDAAMYARDIRFDIRWNRVPRTWDELQELIEHLALVSAHSLRRLHTEV